MRFAFSLHYDGSEFAGFQIQREQKTVQGELERAFEVIFRQQVRVHTAGRTDTGVHAQGQVIHTEIDPKPFLDKVPKIDFEKIIYSVNSLLPHSIRLTHMAEVSDDFHARFSCSGREYLYQILNAPTKLPHYSRYAHWIRGNLDIDKIHEAAAHLIGEKDFAAFTPAIYLKSGERTVRRIDEIRIVHNNPFVWFYYNGSGFLHNMIRIITGTLLAVGQGDLTPDDVRIILESRRREDAGMTIPPTGLFFLNARYDEYQTPPETIPLREELLSLIN